MMSSINKLNGISIRDLQNNRNCSLKIPIDQKRLSIYDSSENDVWEESDAIDLSNIFTHEHLFSCEKMLFQIGSPLQGKKICKFLHRMNEVELQQLTGETQEIIKINSTDNDTDLLISSLACWIIIGFSFLDIRKLQNDELFYATAVIVPLSLIMTIVMKKVFKMDDEIHRRPSPNFMVAIRRINVNRLCRIDKKLRMIEARIEKCNLTQNEITQLTVANTFFSTHVKYRI